VACVATKGASHDRLGSRADLATRQGVLPLFPQKRTFVRSLGMSALGDNQTWLDQPTFTNGPPLNSRTCSLKSGTTGLECDF
jgi:hypothetical protein